MRFPKGTSGLSGKAFIASLPVALVLLLDAMAVCPALHESFHHDANEPDHQCAVTLFSHGQVDSVSVDVPVTTPQIFVFALPQTRISAFRPVIENLPAGRGPPAPVYNS